jgi:hypothetical protein
MLARRTAHRGVGQATRALALATALATALTLAACGGGSGAVRPAEPGGRPGNAPEGADRAGADRAGADALPRALPGTPITFGGGDGATQASAVVIQGAPDHMAGVQSEYRYLALRFGPRGGRWQVQRQALVQEGGGTYDVLDLLVDGRPQSIWFDIGAFWGRF